MDFQKKAEEEEATVEQPDWTNAIFGNNVIFGVIANYLCIPDLKILRQTCKSILVNVNRHQRFSENLLVTIPYDEETLSDVMQHSTIKWKNVRIIIHKATAQYISSVKKVLQDVVCLRFQHSSLRTVGFQGRANCYKLLDFKNCPKLSSLHLDYSLLMYALPVSALREIVGSIMNLRLDGRMPESEQAAQSRTYAQNWEMIGSLGWRLESIYIGSVFSGDLIPTSVNAAGLNAVLTSSANTLEELIADCEGIVHLGKIEDIVFPRLRSVKVMLNSGEEATFSAFLNNQPPLESIKMDLLEDAEATAGLMDAIQLKCRASCEKLHTLELDGNLWLETSSNLEFLKELEKLRSFRLYGGGTACPQNMLQPILENLPSTMDSTDVSSFFSSAEGNWDLRTILALKRFTRLTKLRIHNCRNVLTDRLLQFICTMSGLRTLHLGCSDDITDFGLTGEVEGDSGAVASGISLRNLKGLQKLEIIGCSNLTLSGLLKSVQFSELREADFHYLPRIPIPDASLVELASSNPSLEFVGRFCDGEKPIGWSPVVRNMFSSIAGVNSRLTRIYSNYKSCYYDHAAPEVGPRPSYGVLSTGSFNPLMQCLGLSFEDINGQVVRLDMCYLDPTGNMK